MKRNLTLLIFFFLYSCGGNKSSITQPPRVDYYAADQTFIDELDDLNISASSNDINDRITTASFIDDITGTQYYKIKALNLGEMALDTIPSSIIGLDSLVSVFNSENKLSILESVNDHVMTSVKPLEATDR